MKKSFIIILCCLAFVIYSKSLNSGFVLDDEALVVNNPLIKSASLAPLIFVSGLYDYPEMNLNKIPFDKMYRPLQLASYSFDYKIWGINPFGFHLTNILLHILNGVLVYLLFSMLAPIAVARIASILFIIHPINTSVVSYISGRADLLVCFFMLASVFFFTRFAILKKKFLCIISIFCAALALLCRESAIILPLFIMLILYLLKKQARDYLNIIPFVLLGVAYLFIRYAVFGPYAFSVHPDNLGFIPSVTNLLNIIPRYLLVLVFPYGMHMFRSTPFVTNLFNAPFIFFSLFILVIVYLSFKEKLNKLITFGLLWFIAGFLPVFSSLGAYPWLKRVMMAESWLYFSSLGIFLLFALFLDRIKISRKPVFILLLLFYSTVTFINGQQWRSNVKAFENILKYLPDNNPIHKELARAYLKSGMQKEAEKEVNKFAVLFPEASDRYILEGDLLYYKNEPKQALEKYYTALKVNKDKIEVYYKLSLCYEKLSDFNMAIKVLVNSLMLNPRYFDSLVQMGDLYVKNNDFAQAEKYYRLALNIDPSSKELKEKIKNAK
ncbi:MAG: hypothetical protein PHO70_08095 [Candidatus Omnitrophica bacterium]|nr:hypothetical protein [Candidatus Omnitrophota bacterium]